MTETTESPDKLSDKPGAWVDLALTLPIFLAYHLSVVFLNVKNATDVLTGSLLHLSGGSTSAYLGTTFAIGVVFAGTFALLGRGHAFRPGKFVQIALEGVLYAMLMRVAAGLVMERLFAGHIGEESRFTGFVMSLGAGFYEELAFRVVLFGLGAKVLLSLFAEQPTNFTTSPPTEAPLTLRAIGILIGWALAASVVFSGFHYVGALGDSFKLTSFVFRLLLGLALTLIYATRGFAAAVWTHAVYDIWVLVFR